VDYARAATFNGKSGDPGKEQQHVKLPFELEFYAKGGQFLFLSAQKVRVTKTVLSYGSRDEQEVVYDGVAGRVHVLVRVGGAVLQEASSTAPYGIATAEGKVPD